ncbi:unnamed protein product [Psylliodes chrysocephalus]|uniref:Nose resistant-to-fluoxetine protein N-terminal domain-containing protein n=1 Tax=Psylliodes chrysocephalus TaxID=3402493 RepID=A0A9P0D1L2_9CUCU|nr:unnamed protein product [Psylliodes chrysocephala]
MIQPKMFRWVFFLSFANVVLSRDFENLFDFEKFDKAIVSSFANGDSLTPCQEQYRELRTQNYRAYVSLFDATSKFPWTGVLTSSLLDWGDYDECVDINLEYSKGTITGKYCHAGIILPTSIVPSNITGFNYTEFFTLGLCLPNACTAKDFMLLNETIINDRLCHTKQDLQKFTRGDIVMIVVLVCLATLIIISTSYDVYMHKKQKKISNPLYVAFSYFKNGRKLLETSKKNREQIQIFNGLKTISMIWVIGAHSFNVWNQFSVINREITLHVATSLKTAYISAATLCVDTFFYMSGFLMGFLYMKQKSKPLVKQLLGVPYLIIHRYFRITPAVAMMYFFTITLFKHFGTGPIWKVGVDNIVAPCHKYWWSFFFYLQNYVNYGDVCMIQTWYLSADMQMFIFSPILLIPAAVLLAKSPQNLKLVMVAMTGINVFFIILPLTIKLVFTDYDNTFDTHSRLINFTIGITFGIFMQEAKNKISWFGKIKSPSYYNFIIWTAVCILMLFITLINHEVTFIGHGHTALSITHSLMRPVWCTCLSWMVYSSYHGYGGIVNWILTRPILQITSKLSYCMYIMHVIIIYHFILLSRTKVWFTDYMVFINSCAFFIITFLVSIVWSLSFESPMIIIEKKIFEAFSLPQTNKKSPNKNVEAGPTQEKYKEPGKF